MALKRLSKPWKVVFLAPGGPLPEERYTSERAAYAAVNYKREEVRDGITRVTAVRVYQWDVPRGRWMTFERHDLKAEADAMPPRAEDET